MSDTIYVGATYRGRVKVYNREVSPAALVAPDTLVITVSPPGGGADSTYSLAAGTLTTLAAGDYTFGHVCTIAGVHEVESVSVIGVRVGVGQDDFTVIARNV